MVRRDRLGPMPKLTCADVERALAFSQPGIAIDDADDAIVAEGEYIVSDGPHADGPLARYRVKIFFLKNYPAEEPIVLETAGAIECVAERHMHTNGRCCTCVWEEWLASSSDTSIKAFCDGPLHNFFLGQIAYEKAGHWPFDERSHGSEGIKEAVVAVLGLDVRPAVARRFIHAVAAAELKGYWFCPCGSGRKIRDCHHKTLEHARKAIDRELARALYERLQRAMHHERRRESLRPRKKRGS